MAEITAHSIWSQVKATDGYYRRPIEDLSPAPSQTEIEIVEVQAVDDPEIIEVTVTES